MNYNLKNNTKKFVPPIFLNCFKDFRNYQNFLKHSFLFKKNVELKNKHNGKKCFILGSGPSIKDECLKLIKNETIFALNNFYVHNDFHEIMTGDSEKYYMTAPIHPPQTELEWKEWFSDMEKKMPEKARMIFGINKELTNIYSIISKYNFFSNHNIYWYFTGKNIDDFYKFNLKDIDITSMIWIADTVSIYALIVAIYMGFSEIYMLGMDHSYICNNKENYRFYNNGIHQKNEEERILRGTSMIKHNSAALYNIFTQYELLNNYFPKKIFNISNNSLLDLFDFVKLHDVT